MPCRLFAFLKSVFFQGWGRSPGGAGLPRAFGAIPRRSGPKQAQNSPGTRHPPALRGGAPAPEAPPAAGAGQAPRALANAALRKRNESPKGPEHIHPPPPNPACYWLIPRGSAEYVVRQDHPCFLVHGPVLDGGEQREHLRGFALPRVSGSLVRRCQGPLLFPPTAMDRPCRGSPSLAMSLAVSVHACAPLGQDRSRVRCE
jgi:hypothetical protein